MSAPLLEVREVAKDFGGLRALRGVNLSIGEGEVRCIIGPNGCGKTTLFNIITGTFPPTSGTVLFRGRDITGRAPHEISRLGIARKFQVPGIYPSLAVAENLEVPLLGKQSATLRAMLGGSTVGMRIRELLVRSGMQKNALRLAGALPHGQKQSLEIAMLVGTDAPLLLLDEPTAGLSAAETAATVALIHELQRNHGVAVLVIEHDMRFVRELASPVIVMLRGAVLFEGDYAEVQAHPAVREAYLGQAGG